MKKKFLLALTVFFCTVTFGQKKIDDAQLKTQQFIIKKRVSVDDLESQLKDVQIAAVRVFIRYKLAAWLWKDGADQTERAEPLAVKAAEELFEKKSEIPGTYYSSLKSDIFALLEVNAKESVKKLESKYQTELDSSVELDDIDALLRKKNGDRLAADKIEKYLSSQAALNPFIVSLIERLQKGKSPEGLRLLNLILIFEESGKSRLSVDSLSLIAQNFNDSGLPNDLKLRFIKIALARVNETVRSPDPDLESAVDLLDSIMPGISTLMPDFLPEAKSLKTVLSARVSQSSRELREIYERIEESADKLQATITEAEKAQNFTLKYRLYEQAARLALNENKFQIAADLIDKTIEDDSKDLQPALAFRIQYHDQFLDKLVEKSLKNDDSAAAAYAVKRMLNKLATAEGLRKSANYYYEKQDVITATDRLSEALKLTSDSEIGTAKIFTLFRLISTARKIDRNGLSEFTTKTAKAIDSIPSLKIEDKPGTKNYESYVISIMTTNWNLLPVFGELVRDNKNEAIDFADRINKKEIKFVAALALLTDSLSAEEKALLKAEKK